MRRQRVLAIHFARLKDRSEHRPWLGGKLTRVRELEDLVAIHVTVEPDNEGSFALLRHPRARINHRGRNVVSELLERRLDDFERVAVIMSHKVLHVLKEKNGRWILGVVNKSRNLEEEVAALL